MVDDDNDLPRLPVPTLARSGEQFLDWCAPLLTSEQYDETEQAVRDLLAPNSPMQAVQADIEADERRGAGDSWLDAFWRDRYLGRRDRIAINANFFFLFRGPGPSQAARAAQLVHATLRHKGDLDRGRVPRPTLRGHPLSNVQAQYLFSATRIPGVTIDTSRSPYTSAWPGPSTEKHIVVAHGGRFLSLDVFDADGRAYPQVVIERAVQSVLDAGPPPLPIEEQVGFLTTTARADWAVTRERVRDLDPANADALDTIERALFLLCLDAEAPRDAHLAGDLLLHGDGRGNRWYDKALSFIVFADGRAGLNGEHCNLDGTTMTALIDAICTTPDDDAAPDDDKAPPPRTLDFRLDAALRDSIRHAAAQFADFAAHTVTTAFTMAGFGADDVKARQLSPDAFVQLALQLTHHRSKGFLGATYESVAVRRYRHGRTEAMRVVTPQTVEFVAAMTDPDTTTDERIVSLRTAAEAHVERARACQVGDAPEQHLWELLLRQRRTDPQAVTPALYDSPGWRILRDDYLSTSSVPSVHVDLFGFGATSPHCIGVGYTLLAGSLRVYLSTPSTARAELERFTALLPGTITELLALLDDDRTSRSGNDGPADPEVLSRSC